MTAKDRFLDYYLKAKKKSTWKSYKRGLELFFEWIGKDSDQVLAERKEDILSENFERHKNFDRQVEFFYKWQLEKGYALSSARTNTLGPIQFFRYFGMPISPDIPSPPKSTKTYIPKIEEFRGMFNISDLRERVILSLGLDLAWRVGDFIQLKVEDLPDLEQETPIPIQKVTEKENEISATFLSSETVALLKSYLPTLKAKNPYLFQTNGKGRLDNDTVNLILKGLVKKAKVKIPKGKRFTFHSFRKRFMSTGYSLDIETEKVKLMCGKHIDGSIEVYIGDASFRDAFKEIREEHLSLSNGSIKSAMVQKDETIARLERRIKALELKNEIMTDLLREDLVKKATEKAKALGVDLEDMARHSGITEMTPQQAFDLLAQIREAKQKEEYEKMLENGNHS